MQIPAPVRDKFWLAVLCAWCTALLAARMWYAGELRFAFLVWNLLLAIVPVAMALLMRALAEVRLFAPVQVAAFAAWLAFLPNAPYLVTDFIHLRSRPPVPLWFDVAMLASFAATGVLLCYASVADVEAVLSRRFGRPLAVVVSLGSLALCGVGIYLGRFLRWNSWDILTSPTGLARDALGALVDPAADPRAWAVPVIYGLGLVLGYVTIRALGRAFVLHEAAARMPGTGRREDARAAE